MSQIAASQRRALTRLPGDSKEQGYCRKPGCIIRSRRGSRRQQGLERSRKSACGGDGPHHSHVCPSPHTAPGLSPTPALKPLVCSRFEKGHRQPAQSSLMSKTLMSGTCHFVKFLSPKPQVLREPRLALEPVGLVQGKVFLATTSS